MPRSKDVKRLNRRVAEAIKRGWEVKGVKQVSQSESGQAAKGE